MSYFFYKEKGITISYDPLGGPERIRTAVAAFAELSLSLSATGPYLFLISDFHSARGLAQRKITKINNDWGRPRDMKNYTRISFI
jgi:hypothetical protein